MVTWFFFCGCPMADSNCRLVVNDHPVDPPRLEGVLATLSLKIMLAFIPAILLMLGLSLLHDVFLGEKMARSERPAKMWDWRQKDDWSYRTKTANDVECDVVIW